MNLIEIARPISINANNLHPMKIWYLYMIIGMSFFRCQPDFRFGKTRIYQWDVYSCMSIDALYDSANFTRTNEWSSAYYSEASSETENRLRHGRRVWWQEQITTTAATGAEKSKLNEAVEIVLAKQQPHYSCNEFNIFHMIYVLFCMCMWSHSDAPEHRAFVKNTCHISSIEICQK